MKALELANELFAVSTRCDDHYSLDRSAASELRRLAEVNEELLGALEYMNGVYKREFQEDHVSERADSAIAKAKEQQ